ncbi:MAG: type II toxin-antitoxin system VapC family toxin [Gemmatimonadetes bacterium]|nr:type II toxin-antitoxin system VapC family toxin [Gemmatimonadota bacterium]
MDFYYFDTSVLAKAYIWEVGTEDVRKVLGQLRAAPARARIITSRVAFAEAMSAVSRREYAGELTPREATEIATRLQGDFAGPVLPYVVIDAGSAIVHHAADLARQHRLRALDAIHLATGLAARFNTRGGIGFHFGSADQRLNRAAVSEGLAIFNPQSPLPSGILTRVAPPA